MKTNIPTPIDNEAVKTIYFMLNTAFLMNDRTKSDYFLGMLQNEVKKCDLKMNMALGDVHFERFYKIRESINNKQYGRLYGSGYSTPDQDIFIPKEVNLAESELHKLLMKKESRGYLFNCIGASPKAHIVHEYGMHPYGRCDMLIRDGRIWHVVEVKREIAPTSIVAQIDKYRLCAELEMSSRMHDEVRASVIAQCFPQYVRSELSRISVKMISHEWNAESLKVIA